MAKIDTLLELLRTLIITTIESTIKINKDYLFEIQTCLQYAQEKIDFLELEA